MVDPVGVHACGSEASAPSPARRQPVAPVSAGDRAVEADPPDARPSDACQRAGRDVGGDGVDDRGRGADTPPAEVTALPVSAGGGLHDHRMVHRVLLLVGADRIVRVATADRRWPG
jgi:hypothetical protein